jgi:hypothetical protein
MTKCTFNGSKYIPCQAITDKMGDDNAHQKGLSLLSLINMETGDEYYGGLLYRFGKKKDDVLICNYCPICGERITLVKPINKSSKISEYTPKLALNGKLIYLELSGKYMTFKEAQKYAKNCRESGFADWRLPTKEETLACNLNGVPSDGKWCWSSTQYKDWGYSRYVWKDANIGNSYVSGFGYYVRLVRDVK